MPADKETYKKSLLFEIVNRKDRSKPVESFVLSIPPENLEIEEPQRVKTTKTFGGVFIDDFGPDTLAITISGHTGGKTPVKTLVRGGVRELDGKSSFYQFRNSIMRYKSRRSIPNYADYEMLLYDLSTTAFETPSKLNAVLSEGYVVVLKKFKMRRSKERPLFYSYNIELEGIRPLGTYTGEAPSPVVLQNPQSLMTAIRKGFNSVSTFFYEIDAIKDQVDSFFDLIDQTSTKIDAFFSKTVDLAFYPLELCKRMMSSFNTLFDSIESITETAFGITGRTDKERMEMEAIVTEIGYSIAALVVFGKTPEASGNVSVKDITEPSKSRALQLRYEELTEEQAQVDDLFMDVDITSSEDVVAYGYVLVIPDATTTLAGLAAEYYDNPALLSVIASFNGFEGDEDIVVGSPIKVPVLIQGAQSFDNRVFTEIVSDVYGVDLRLDAHGNLVVSGSGDLAVIEGPDNLIQALNLRLNESLGSRLRLTVYGIRNAVGGAMSNSGPVSYIVTNIKDTVQQDPRVSEVYNMRVRGRGDMLDISFDTETIKLGEMIPFVGGV